VIPVISARFIRRFLAPIARLKIDAKSRVVNGTAAAARTAFDTAERLWESTQSEAPAREGASRALYLLYRECIRGAIVGLRDRPPVTAVASISHELSTDAAVPEAPTPAQVLAARLAALRLLELVEAPERARHEQRVAKLRRTGALLVSALLGFGAATFGVMWLLMPRDLTIGHPWKASSKFAECHPDQTECTGLHTAIFFHTNEEDNPWLEWDLERPTSFSRMTIENRKDLGMNRAMPLIIEVSDDEKTWREVLRRDDEFSTWRPSFPTQTARYVRLRVPRRVYFHLEAARVHP
jgi:hypothetical protein